MSLSCTSPARWAWRVYLHPWSLFALMVLGLNDRFLKSSDWLPSLLTGKLSDIAGLFFFPRLLFLLLAIFQKSRLKSPTHLKQQLVFCAAFTAVIFSALQLSPSFVWLFKYTLEALPLHHIGRPSITMDPWDLLTLPTLWLGHRQALSLLPQLLENAEESCSKNISKK